ncbi:hypothetical protein B9Q13_04900 [Candidatus Marsarchaeota G2 archaeon ECH_B_SAG-G16]|jgi:hypothetical protein|uniref:Uncharacterized protein n=3 Tax=Candidatus Marsarchaeota TaxID=1978152 RepID=A0A2R6C3S6_9ARCH|nr:MAG: hypothetical protein B9Q13_04900 [Candidatus Marsarchaeota G2 archaeon ECH_B_SAG-G16]PSO05542.1 MAG: hypothetical protein B9Q12_00330 [Candidatus Marsarchaeota G2 archaeon ECH_B_SAG-G06]
MRMIRLVRGVGIPYRMRFVLKRCTPAGYTKKAIEAGDALKLAYLPGYLEFECIDPESVVKEAKKKGFRVYKGKRHFTISDGVWQVRIYATTAK